MNSQAYYLRQYQTRTRSYQRVRVTYTPVVRFSVLLGCAAGLLSAYVVQGVALFCIAVWGGL